MAYVTRSRGRVDVMTVVCCVLLSTLAMVTPGQTALASLLRRTVVAPLLDVQEASQRWRSAWVHRQGVTLAADSVAMAAVQAHALQIENAQLRGLIGLGRRVATGFVPAEALRSPAGEDYHFITSLTLTAGRTAGVRKYSPVITPDGLVGVVQSADPTVSIAILYTNPDFRVSATSTDGRTFGIVYPHLAEGIEARDQQYLLELRDVPFRDTLRQGAHIYTAGIGGVWPVGIPIGTVVKELTEADGLSRTYLIAPAVNPSDVTTVMILTPQRDSQGVGNVWATTLVNDSVSRRIVAAGDSLARVAAARQAQDRLASLDSVRRAVTDSILRVYGLHDTAAARSDSARRGAAAAVSPAGDSAVRDSIRRDSARRAHRDSIRRDSIRRDSLMRRTHPDTGRVAEGEAPQ